MQEVKIKRLEGISECFQCGKLATNKHHAIPICFNPKHNVKIPLCDEHKDIMHHTIKQFYFPKELRHKLAKARKHNKDVMDILESLHKNLQFHNLKSDSFMKSE